MKTRAPRYEDRLPGIYRPDGFRDSEADPQYLISACWWDEAGHVVHGGRVSFVTDHKELPHHAALGSEGLTEALDGLSREHGGLIYCDYGGLFTDPPSEGKGLARLLAGRLYRFANEDIKADIVFVAAIPDTAGKYHGWGARPLGMQQLYFPARSMSARASWGSLMVESMRGKETLPLDKALRRATTSKRWTGSTASPPTR
ncbi:MAG: hypothetical protein WDN72_08935 [Alphaproteobacteria bacterium]